jgi:G:T-mismatch repair DNA endonuclease (very short patch repair protein)
MQGCAVPKSNTPLWIAKFSRNVERDGRTAKALEDVRWRVVPV